MGGNFLNNSEKERLRVREKERFDDLMIDLFTVKQP
jgi:hypothetical protein